MTPSARVRVRVLATAGVAAAAVAAALLAASLDDGAGAADRPCTLTSRIDGATRSGNASDRIAISVRLVDAEASRYRATAKVKRGVRGIALCRGTVFMRDVASRKIERRIQMKLGADKRILTASFTDTSPARVFGVDVRARRS